MPKVVVSGMGAICSLGTDSSSFWNGLILGNSGIKSITAFDQTNLRNIHAGEIVISSDMLEYAERKKIKSRLSLFASWAIEQAIIDSGFALKDLKKKRVGLIIGTSLGMSLIEGVIQYVPENTLNPNNLAEDLTLICNQLGEIWSISGDILVLSTACASGTHAIGLAKNMILYEDYDAVICGGADSLDRMKYLGHSALNTLTQTMIRPYDSLRNGTLFGEGAAFLMLEKEKPNSDKKPYAFCSGIGYSCDAYHVTMPDPEGRGAIYSMKDALNDAEIKADDVGYINLHGSGTPLNDSVEGKAIETVFGSSAESIPASSIKAAIGHTMGAAGALEAVTTIMSIVNQKVPATLNVNTADPTLKIKLVYNAPYDCKIDHAISNSFGFGGSNGTLVFSKIQN